MDVKTFCDSLRSELTGWKAKTYDLMRKLDQSPGAAGNIDELHRLIDQVSGQIETLERECPSDWGPEKKALEEEMAELREKWETVAEMSPDDFE